MYQQTLTYTGINDEQNNFSFYFGNQNNNTKGNTIGTIIIRRIHICL